MTDDLNALIKKGTNGVYTGGTGVLVRNPFDGFSDDQSKSVLPATFWVNDIFAISQLYPNGNPMHPTHGAEQDDPWKYAQVGLVVGSEMSKVMNNWNNVQDKDWGYGVFYAYDSNSVDKRCRWKPDYQEYDCPGGFIPWGKNFIPADNAKGSGSYPMGNPDVNDNLGGGSGCHFANNAVDQANGDDGHGNTLLGNQHCECSYSFKSQNDPHGYSVRGNGWDSWVDKFKLDVIPQMSDQGASWNGDLAMCWVNNPRDMINLQNWMFWKRTYWSSEDVPYADYFHYTNYGWTRRYWGWNEVPVSRAIQTPQNWDAIVVLLPAFTCGGKNLDIIDCLDGDALSNLDSLLDTWVRKGYMLVGQQAASQRPGSSVVMARQTADSSGNFQTQFFCKNWGGAPGGKYTIIHEPPTHHNPNGGCWLDYRHGNSTFTIIGV